MSENLSNLFADDNYYVIQGWMSNHLPLKGNTEKLFALIFGFSQDGKSKFQGSINYIASALKVTRKTAIKLTDELMELKLIKKSLIGGVNHYCIRIEEVRKQVLESKENTVIIKPLNVFNRGVINTPLSDLGSVINTPLASKEITPNNNKSNNSNKRKEKKRKEKTDYSGLSAEGIKIRERVGEVQFKLLHESREIFAGLGKPKLDLFIDWLEHRGPEFKNVPCGTLRVLKKQLSYFFKSSLPDCRKAVDIATTSGEDGWQDIKYGFMVVNKEKPKEEQANVVPFTRLKYETL